MNAEEKPEDAGASRAEPIAALMGISMRTDKFTARDPSDSFLELAAMDHSSNTNPASAPSTIESVAEVRNSLAYPLSSRDYAVECFDTRDPWLESHFNSCVDESAVERDREDVRESARLELRALRKAAALPGS